MTSVVIPARDEASVIERCLGALLRDAEPGELEVVVVCNACSDDTAERARRFGPTVRVVETRIASKCQALNRGDEAASRFPRFYVDADVVLPTKSLRLVAQVLREGSALVASPALELDLVHCSRLVRAYYAIWTRLPYVRDDLIGSGVYALSEEGRARFGRFPETLADDGYVRLLFDRDERRSVAGAAFVVRPPADARRLIPVVARRRGGIVQLRDRFPSLLHERRSQRSALLRLARTPRLSGALAVYLAVRGAAEMLHRWRLMCGRAAVWTRDETSRSGGPAA